MENKYYILPIDDIAILNLNSIIGDENTVRYNLAKTKFLVKTEVGAEDLQGYEKLTHSQVFAEMQKVEWQNNEV